MALEHGVAVYNFHDTHKDAVVIEVAGKNLSVRPGASALVVPEHVRSFAPVNPAQLVCYRHMIEQQLENGMKAFRAEFSMQSAIEAIKPLKTMILSKQKETSRVAERFLQDDSDTDAASRRRRGVQAGYEPANDRIPAVRPSWRNCSGLRPKSAVAEVLGPSIG